MKCSTKKKFAAVTTTAGMITISAFVGHTTIEYNRNIKAAQKVEDVVSSQCFETEWLSSDLDENQTNGQTKAEVLEEIRTMQIKIALEMYRSWVNTVGYTYESTDHIWMNRKFHDRFTVCEVAANQFHEILHKAGFDHDVKATARRPRSVNYMGGTILKECCEE